MINWTQRQRLKALVGQPVDDLEGDDYALFWGLMTESRVAIHDGNVARIPVAYGDGKKSPYGVTYADELIGDFA